MRTLGYEFLRQSLQLSAFPLKRPAREFAVTKVAPAETSLAVPPHVAPADDDPVSHLLFALKHEGTNLQVLSEALPLIDAKVIRAHLAAAPSSAYVRLMCYLWEAFNQRQLEDIPAIGGANVPLFDPEKYVTAPPLRNARWRVLFNGLGSLKYCVTVERTPGVQQALAADVLGRVGEFLAALDAVAMDRALAWAYMHETESSFAIEREAPTQDKASAFIALLHQAHEPRTLDEDYFVELQNTVITNPYEKAAAYRHEQNWLQGPLKGAAGVTYVPPSPQLVPELMSELVGLVLSTQKTVDPLVVAAIASFGFVFIHPFMDGNGRLSRFLFHHALCQSGKLARGLLLPVSVAMKRNEQEYLTTLQQFSVPARERWKVLWLDDGNYAFEFKGSTSIYRYWDATACVEFGYRMAEQALEIDLRKETEFLARYDAVFKEVDAQYDVRGSDLATLVRCCLENDGRLSKKRRRQYQYKVPVEVLDAIELAAQASVAGNEDDEAD